MSYEETDDEQYISYEEMMVLARRTNAPILKAFNLLSVQLSKEKIPAQFVAIAAYISFVRMVTLVEKEFLEGVSPDLISGFRELADLEPMRLATSAEEISKALGLKEGAKA